MLEIKKYFAQQYQDKRKQKNKRLWQFVKTKNIQMKLNGERKPAYNCGYVKKTRWIKWKNGNQMFG